jgi:hypothetical protein
VQVWNQRQPQPTVDRGPAASPEPAAAGAPRVTPVSRAEAERAHQAYVASVDDGFQREPIGPRWASATASAVHAAISGDDALRSATRGAECRSHTCRVDIADDGSGRLNEAVRDFVQRIGRELPTVVFNRVEDTGGGATLVLYMHDGAL